MNHWLSLILCVLALVNLLDNDMELEKTTPAGNLLPTDKSNERRFSKCFVIISLFPLSFEFELSLPVIWTKLKSFLRVLNLLCTSEHESSDTIDSLIAV